MAVSNLNDGIFLTALSLLAATLTRDPLGCLWSPSRAGLPWLVLGLLSGVLVDLSGSTIRM